LSGATSEIAPSIFKKRKNKQKQPTTTLRKPQGVFNVPMLCPRRHLELVVPPRPLARQGATAPESNYSTTMTWEFCDETQPGN